MTPEQILAFDEEWRTKASQNLPAHGDWTKFHRLQGANPRCDLQKAWNLQEQRQERDEDLQESGMRKGKKSERIRKQPQEEEERNRLAEGSCIQRGNRDGVKMRGPTGSDTVAAKPKPKHTLKKCSVTKGTPRSPPSNVLKQVDGIA